MMLFARSHLNALVDRKIALFPAVVFCLAAAGIAPAMGGEADIVAAKAELVGETWRFDVTVRHDDTGWDHYADKWDIVGADGTVFGTRVLAHPHENEQPFTRSISGLEIPETVREVVIRGHDSVHGYGGKEVKVTLER